jgi:protein phosphatase
MNRTEQPHLPVVALTHPGRRGKNNEDRYGVFAYRMAGEPGTPVILAVLADGIGGHRAGEVAAEMAVNGISGVVAASDGANPPAILEEAIETASNQIYKEAQASPDRAGMGSTCAVAWVAGNRLFTATVGDSRIYLLRGTHVQQLSVDHTWIQEALERGILTPEETFNHPNTHVIRRYLGSPQPPQVDFRLRLTEEQGTLQAVQNQGLALQTDDVLLLCSDGLSDLVEGPEILTAFRSEKDIGSACEDLIALANDRGGHDNITLIAIQMQELPAGLAAPTAFDPQATARVPVTPIPAARAARPVAAAKGGRRRPLWAGCAGLLAVALMIAAVLGAFYLYRQTIGAPDATPTPTPPVTLEAPGNLPTLPTPTGGTQVTPRPQVTPKPATRTPRPGGATLTPWPTNTNLPTLEL